MKHAKPETPLERADRMIWELETARYQTLAQHLPDDAVNDFMKDVIR